MPEEACWDPDDAFVIEVEAVAKRLGTSFQDSVSFLVGLGLGHAREIGLIGERVTEPMDPEELFRRLAESILRGP